MDGSRVDDIYFKLGFATETLDVGSKHRSRHDRN